MCDGLEVVETARFTVVARRERRQRWFGRTVASFTKQAASVDFDDPGVRAVIEPHVRKMRRKREIQVAEPAVAWDFDRNRHPLDDAFARAIGVTRLGLPWLHNEPRDKQSLLAPLVRGRRVLEEAYEQWMLEDVLPKFFGEGEVWMQRFPCVRVHCPGELTIGPHCDAMYGHVPTTLNVIVPLTPCRGTACLVYESLPGKEDWTRLEADGCGRALFFAGGLATHFTSENTTGVTRVSLDARLLTTVPTGQYERGYYVRATFERGRWRIDRDSSPLDARIGLPFGIEPVFIKPPRRQLLLRQAEIDALYDVLDLVDRALRRCSVEYCLIAGSLLGAVRSKSILFCDDDVDIAVIDVNAARVALENDADLARLASFKRRPWPACDRVRPKAASTTWIDVFGLKRFGTRDELRAFVEFKRNGTPQDHNVVAHCLAPLETFPLYHYDSPEAIRLWPREFFRPDELFPLRRYAFGGRSYPGPRFPLGHLLRAFGLDAFDVFIVASSHDKYRPGADHTRMPSLPRDVKVPLRDTHLTPVLHSRDGRPPEGSRRALDLELRTLLETEDSHTPPNKENICQCLLLQFA